MKAIRERIALQKHFVRNWSARLKLREALGVRVPLLASLFDLPLRFFELLPDFAFLATNILQMALEERKLRFLWVWVV